MLEEERLARADEPQKHSPVSTANAIELELAVAL